MQKVLITGGNGFIGRNLREKLVGGYHIQSPSSKELDLTDYAQVETYLRKNDFDIVIHTATWNATANTVKDGNLVLAKNLSMFFNLARMNDRYGKMIYYGSGAEYDRKHYEPHMKEDHFDRHVPEDQYGFSKYIMGKYVEGTDNILDLRIFGCFGPYEDWEIRFISNAMCKALHGMPITMRQNIFLDYIWIGDLVRMTEWFMQNEGEYKHYNACTGRSIDLMSLAKIVRDVAGKDVPIVVGEDGLKTEYSGNNERILKEMGGFEFTTARQAIEQLKEFYAANLSSIDRNKLLQDKH